MKRHHKIYLTTSLMTLSSFLVANGAYENTVPVFAQEKQVSTTKEDKAVQHYEQMPQSTALFPNALLEWQFETDPNAPFNVSKVPLANRVNGPNINPYQSQKAKVLSIAIVNKHTSGTLSQGGPVKEIYNFTNWQYIDTLVAWAGSAGEGIIVPPSGDITDVAHRNGVPVLGTVFFPPEAYGGKAEWVKEFVKKDAQGRFIVADKLLDMANAYGFDGWFINQETDVDSQTASDLKALLLYLQQHKKEHQQIVWYDSMLPSGEIIWQGELNDDNKMYFQDGSQRISDKMFLDFRWDVESLSASKDLALELNRDPFDVFAGLDVQAEGIHTYRKPRHILDENGQLKMSIGLYVPDWTLRDGAKYNLKTYWENEQKFWINKQGDPRQVLEKDLNNRSAWLGISKYVVEKTPVTTLPFLTHFNVGNGTHNYQQGKLIQTGDFNNRSVQDILPTYRWIIDNGTGNQLKASFTYEKAFNGGSSILLAGTMAQDISSFIKLYATSLNVEPTTSAYIVTNGAKKVDLVVDVADQKEPVIISSKHSEPIGEGGWSKQLFSLEHLAGKKITSIGLNIFGENGEQAIYIGELGVGDFKTPQTVSPITSVNVLGKTVHDDSTESVRLSWESDGLNTSGYAIYREDENGLHLVSTTSNTAFTLIEQKRSQQAPKYIVVPRDNNHVEHMDKKSSVSYQFEPLEKPKVAIQADKTFIGTGDTVTFTAQASPSTESIKWLIPEGDIVSQTENSITVTFKKPGVYSAFVTAKNPVGETTTSKENYVSVYDKNSAIAVENLSLLPNISAGGSGYTNDNETYFHALDNHLNTKWCDNGNEHPHMMVDLGEMKTLTGFTLHHAQAGGESAEWNTKDYDILVSSDGENWEKVVEHRQNTQAVTHDNIATTKARYVLLYIQKAESTGNTARIYEFQILGVNQSDVNIAKNATLVAKLRDLYYTTLERNKDDYTKESVSALDTALQQAKTVLDDPQSETQIQQHIDLLTNAINHLVLKPIPVYISDGINVTFNEDKSIATFKDNNNDTDVFVKVPVALLPNDVQSLVVNKHSTKIDTANPNLFETYDIYFVDKQGNEQPLKSQETHKDIEVTIPIDSTRDIVNAHLLSQDGLSIAKDLDWTITGEKAVNIHTDQFRRIAISFKPEKTDDVTSTSKKNEIIDETTRETKETKQESLATSQHTSQTMTHQLRDKTLPKTGDTNSFVTVIFGLMMSIGGFLGLRKNHLDK